MVSLFDNGQDNEKDQGCLEEKVRLDGNTDPPKGNMGSPQKRPVTSGELYRLLLKQQFRCAITGRKLTPINATIDHINPRVIDGDHGADNLQWVHKEVNRAKGPLTTSEFIRICLDAAEWHWTGGLNAVGDDEISLSG